MVVRCLFSQKGSFSEDLAELLKAGLVARLSSCAGLGCNRNLEYLFFFLSSRPRRSGRAVFSLLQASAVVGLLVRWLKLFPRMLEMQAGLCVPCDPFDFGRMGVSA